MKKLPPLPDLKKINALCSRRTDLFYECAKASIMDDYPRLLILESEIADISSEIARTIEKHLMGAVH